MIKSSSNSSPAFVPGLLPWQSYFLAFVLGIFSFKYTQPAFIGLVVLVIADTNFRGWPRRLPVLAFIFCAVFGFGYTAQRSPDPVVAPVWMEARRPAMVTGVVERVEPRVGGRLRLVLSDLRYDLGTKQGRLPGKLTWNWRKPDYDPVPGQTVTARLRVLPVRSFGNPGAWDFEWYWQRQGVFWRAWPAGRDAPISWGERPENMLWSIKSRLRKGVSEHIPDTQGGAMVLALVTGDRSHLERATAEATRAAGLAHTLALSGLHVGFVAAFGIALAWLAGWIYPPLLLSIPRPKLAVLLAAPLVLGYAWLGQPSQSLIRAATMFAFWGFLLLQGRGRVLMDGLFFALTVIIFVMPFSVFDLSLQMSAVAVAGIGLLYPRVRLLFSMGQRWWLKPLGWAGGLLAVSLCANIALLPLVSWNFGTWSPNLLLNLVWLPVLGFAVMPLGILGMILVAFSWTAPMGGELLLFAGQLMDWLLGLLHLTGDAGLTPVFAVLRPLWQEILGCGLLVVVALVAWVNRRPFIGLAGLGFLLMVIPHISVMATDTKDEVRLTIIDVGLGQSALISLPGGHRWLVDGGGGSSNFDIGEAVVAPYLSMGRPPRLDGVFMSHPDSDHSHGLPFILSRFDVGTFYFNGMMPRGRTGKRMRRVLEEKGIVPVSLMAGQRIGMADDISLEILHPSPEFKNSHANEHSLVMRLVRQGKPLALLPGDVERKGIGSLLTAGHPVGAEVLILPHHGSKTSLVPAFYNAVLPEVVLCSNGYLNKFGFPHSRVVNSVGVPIYTTSRHGQVTAVWDVDNQMSVRGFSP
ncbi:MAG: DNA internalization-related competence protein ComEC/Rec2 [Pseudodesulfovibrio sp.]